MLRLRRRHWRSLLLGLVPATVSLTAAPAAQAQLAPNLHYDGRVTLARLKYTPVAEPGGCQAADSPAGQGWGHDYPMSVQGLLKAATELLSVEAVVDSNLVLTADDPELLKYPLLMVTEPGCWNPTDKEAKALREYLLKGGFLFADDPTFGDCTPEHCALAIERFEQWMKKVLPDGRVIHLPASDPVFDGFFKLDPTDLPGYSAEPAQIAGIYQDNDPTKRLLVVANYWATLGQTWRYVSTDLGSGIEQGGAEYRMGLNTLIYSLTH